MAPLIVLVAVTLLARLAGYFRVAPLWDWVDATRVGLAVIFSFTAAAPPRRGGPALLDFRPPPP